MSVRDLLKAILSIQELDIKMIRFMRLKNQRKEELLQIKKLHEELQEQLKTKKEEIASIQDECVLYEQKIQEHKERVKKLESKQFAVKKVDEFNALTKEITLLEKEKTTYEQTLSDLVDQKNTEEEIYNKTQQTLQESEESSKHLSEEILETIKQINEEGSSLKKERDTLAEKADPEILAIYERLLQNKKDRVVVPLENRYCTGCHIALTAQHENVVRKGENLVFCEHCSRIHFWTEFDAGGQEKAVGTKRRRRKTMISSY